MDEKALKLKLKEQAIKNPEKFYPVKTLRKLGFSQYKCRQTGTIFWSTKKRDYCEDSSVAGFGFIGSSPAKKKLDYIETWQQFAKIHKKLGYTPVERYPVVARWNPTMDFTIASIAAFQPFVVSGEVAPPANPLVIPQFCLRFNDIDNVGITGAHYSGFVMMGQLAFVPPDKYDIDKYLSDHLYWLNHGLGLSNDDITIHQDAWSGGGNLGASVEFFSRGLELSNQVYMQYEICNNSWKDLKIKVLDMGQGHERVPWFTHGESTSYETTFPTVVKKLRSITGLNADSSLMKKFLPYAAWLNADEVDNLDLAWERVSKQIKEPVKKLRPFIEQQAALYSIAEHSRSLLFALSDGALPSNVGGGYNLRVILRRALDLGKKYGWDVSLPELCKLHADYLKPLFPELCRHLDDVKKILQVEQDKYESSRKKAKSIISRIIKDRLSESQLLQLYDSHGITPELIKEESASAGTNIKIPDNFYAKVASLHEKKVQQHETTKYKPLNVEGVTETQSLYFDDWKPKPSDAKVLKIIDNNVILDRTWFYPTSGGQLNDEGNINGVKVIDVFKQGKYIIHKLESRPSFKENEIICASVDIERRKQLAQHHTATHIINAAARKVLGNHINQAGAKKIIEKASIDLTHYAALTSGELLSIEEEANSIVKSSARIHKKFMPRDLAEKQYGMTIYQGGVAPGKELRIVEIEGIDAEACGGTHLNNTAEAVIIHLIGSCKIADDIVRLEFTAGNAAKKWESAIQAKAQQIKKLVGITPTYFDMLNAAQVFSVSVEQLPETLSRFISEARPGKLAGSLADRCVQVFDIWKKKHSQQKHAGEKVAGELLAQLKEKHVGTVNLDLPNMRNLALQFKEILLANKECTFVFKGTDKKFKELHHLGAKGGGTNIKQGKLPSLDVLKKFRF